MTYCESIKSVSRALIVLFLLRGSLDSYTHGAVPAHLELPKTIISAACFQAFIHGIDQNPVATLAQELGLTLIPMTHCKLSTSDGKSVEPAMDERVQALWNSVLDECAEKQNLIAATEDSGRRSEESHAARDNSTGREVVNDITASHPCADRPSKTETDGNASMNGDCRDLKSQDRMQGEGARHRKESNADDSIGKSRNSTAPPSVSRSSTSLGQVLEDTARSRIANFSKTELELWGWHRGNLEISCGAVRTPIAYLRWRLSFVRTRSSHCRGV